MSADDADSSAVADRHLPVAVPPGGRGWAAAAGIAALSALGLLALLCIANSFVHHITPDISVYLLHARTFVREGNRFALSHDSKGLMMALALAPAVLLFGAGMAAAAASQLVAYALAFFAVRGVARSFASARSAAIMGLLVICAAFSPRLWGGNARPEDFALGYVSLALLAAWRATPRWLAAGGAMTALCLFTKTTLALAPGAVVIAGCVLDAARHARSPGPRPPLRRAGANVLWAAAGFCLASGAMLGWIALADDPAGWYRQTIEWPIEHRGASLVNPDWRRLWGMLGVVRLRYLLAVSFAGLAAGLFHGHARLSALAAVALLAELWRAAAEGVSWPYTLAVSLAPLVVGAAVLGTSLAGPRQRDVLAWIAPLCCLLPATAAMPGIEAEALRCRLVERLPSPYEQLAGEMRKAGYAKGETLFVWSNDYQLFLLLDAPRPEPLLPLHYDLSSPAEQAAVRERYARRPPQWVVTPCAPGTNGPAVRGDVDGPLHVVLGTATAKTSPPIAVAGTRLSPMLPSAVEYRLTVDTGLFRAWRLSDAGRRRCVPSVPSVHSTRQVALLQDDRSLAAINDGLSGCFRYRN